MVAPLAQTVGMQVGDWRKLFAHLPDDATIVLQMGNNPPDNLRIGFDALIASPGDAPMFPAGPHAQLVLSILDSEDGE